MNLCAETDMSALVETMQRGDGDDLKQVEGLIARFPDDPRLHFLRGSILAARQRAIEAHAALSRAVELAPDYHIARYQLGFFELTSGEVDDALSTWGPLLRLPDNNYLRLFVEALIHLARDEFGLAIARMQDGIALNTENAPLNSDIRLLIAECEKLAARESGGGDAGGEGDGGSDLSATSIMLGQFSPGSTKH